MFKPKWKLMTLAFLLVPALSMAKNRNNEPCRVSHAKVSDQTGELSDTFVIIKAAGQLFESDRTAIQVKEMPGQVVVCDTDSDGQDCHAREVVLSDGKRKLLMVLQRDQGPLFKAGDAVLIDKSNLTYIDRTKELDCLPADRSQLYLNYTNGANIPVIEAVGFHEKLWPLRSAIDDKETDMMVFQHNIEAPAYMPDGGNINIPANTAIRNGMVGLICSRATTLHLGPTPKAIEIPVLKGE